MTGARGWRPRPRPLAAMLAGLAALLIGGMLTTGLAAGKAQTTSQLLAGSGLALMLATVAAVGLIVAWHQPGNPIGWLLLTIALCFLLTFNAGSYDGLIYYGHHPGLPLGREALLLQRWAARPTSCSRW